MGGSTKAMKTQVLGPIAPNCREIPGGAHGEYRDLMPPLPLKGIDICNARPNAEARHAVIARIEHLSCSDLEIGA